eukprot:TRINITY_DN29951_c0_g1_i1.p1 TRINITY_DN29951_c0_g1~~TRINITY_DN29951_c0_g1_i1.p1  ORF type:complete len:2142 (+),score=778.52 TRINITY_DN29951_c0_g1_i1:129-6428(+)
MATVAMERPPTPPPQTDEAALSRPAVRWKQAGLKIREHIQQAKRAEKDIDPLLNVASRLRRVPRKSLSLVASLLGYIERVEADQADAAAEDTWTDVGGERRPKTVTQLSNDRRQSLSAAGADDADASFRAAHLDEPSRKVVQGWASQREFADLSSNRLDAGDLQAVLTAIVTSVAQVQGEAAAVQGVTKVLKDSISKAALKKAFGEDFVAAAGGCDAPCGIYADGLDKPHIVKHSHYHPEHATLYPPKYSLPEGESAAATIQQMATWYDPRGVKIWGGAAGEQHDPIADLLSNGLFIASKVAETPPEVVLPIYAYTHEVLERAVYAVWLDGQWVKVPATSGLNDSYRRRRDGEGPLNLTQPASKELSAALTPQDREAFEGILWGGWWGFGELPLFGSSPHGVRVYRKTLAVALPSGLDTLVLVQYENVYADNERWKRAGGYGDTKAPFADSVAWLPPAHELTRAGPFSLWNMPPPSVLEYIYARAFDEVVEYSDWSSTPVQQLPELVAECAAHDDAQQYDADLHERVKETIGTLQCKHVLRDIYWEPAAPPPQRLWFSTTLWEDITVAQVAPLVDIYLKEDTQFVAWRPHEGAVKNEDGEFPEDTLGTACLGNFFESVQARKCPGGRVYVSGSALPIRWKSKYKAMPAPAASSLSGRVQHAKRCLSSLTKYKAMQFNGKEAVFVDLSETDSIEPAQDDELLVVEGMRFTAKGTDPTFLSEVVAEKLGGVDMPNPCLLASALQLQYLVWKQKVYMCSLSGERLLLIDLDSEELVVLTRMALLHPRQPFDLINTTIRQVQSNRESSQVILERRDDAICRASAGLSFKAHPPGADDAPPAMFTPAVHSNFNKTATCTWCPLSTLWKIVTTAGQEKRFAEHEVQHQLNGWLGWQLRAFVFRLTTAIQQLPSDARCGYKGFPRRLPGELYHPSSLVFFGAPTLATTDPNLALQTMGGGGGGDGNACSLFSFSGKQCSRVDAFSRFSRRGDILFPVNTMFHVVEAASYRPGRESVCASSDVAVFSQSVAAGAGMHPSSFLSRRLSSHVEKERTMVRVFELVELDTGGALMVTIRTIMPRLTGPRTQELCRQLFQITQKLEAKKYEEALQIAALPAKGVLLITLPDECGATTGTIIAGELLKLLPEKVGTATLNTALFQAGKGISKAVLPLAELGAEPNAVEKQTGNTPLHTAAGAQVEPLEVLRELLAIGADANEDNHHGDMPIHIAAGNALIPLSEHDDLLRDLCPPNLLNASNAKGQTPIHLAAKACNVSTVKALLAKGANPNASFQCKKQDSSDVLGSTGGKKKKHEASFSTPLHEAAAKGSSEICRMLLDAGANPDAQNGEAQTALHLAVASAQFTTTEDLEIIPRLSTKRTVVATDLVYRVTPLHLAASLGELDVVKILLNTPGRDRLELANLVDQNGNTPMRAASVLFRIAVVLYLLPLTESGLNPKDFPASKVKNAGPELLRAVTDVECAKVLLLINCGVSTDIVHEGHPLLHLVCARSGFSTETGLAVVEKLAMLPNAFMQDVDGETPLHICVRLQHKDICKVLLRHTTDSNLQDADGRSPAHIAAKLDLVDMMYVLLYYNRLQRKSVVDVNVVDYEGKTPLHLAAESGAAAVTALLLKEGANASLVDSQGCTPGNLATINRHEAIAALLPASEKLSLPVEEQKRTLFTAINSGSAWEVLMLLETFHIDLSLKDNDTGLSPFHTAVSRESFNTDDSSQLIEKLVYPGAVGGIIDVSGVGHRVTALHLAASNAFCHTISALLKLGADPNAESGEGLRPMHLAAQNLHIDALSLLRPVTNVELTVRDFRPSALHRAASAGNVAAVALLCDLANDDEDFITAADSFMGSPSGRPCMLESPGDHSLYLMGSLPVHYAISRPQFATEAGIKAFERLVTPRAVQAHTHHQRSTPLHCITQGMCHDTFRMAEILLTKGADPNALDSDGNTPFALACESGLVRIVVQLLHHRTHVDGVSPPLPKDFELWAACTVLVVPARLKAISLCREWVKSLDEKRRRSSVPRRHSLDTDASDEEIDVAPTYQRVVDMVGWAEWKGKYLGMMGSVLTVKDTYLHLEFHVPINDTDYSVDTVWFPKTLVTKLQY